MGLAYPPYLPTTGSHITRIRHLSEHSKSANFVDNSASGLGPRSRPNGPHIPPHHSGDSSPVSLRIMHGRNHAGRMFWFFHELFITFVTASLSKSLKPPYPWQQPPTPPPTALTQGASSRRPNAKRPTKRSSKRNSHPRSSPSVSPRASLRRQAHPSPSVRRLA